MAYSPPSLSTAVTLLCSGYSPPSLTEDIILCQSAEGFTVSAQSGATGAVAALADYAATVAGQTGGATGSVSAQQVFRSAVGAQAGAWGSIAARSRLATVTLECGSYTPPDISAPVYLCYSPLSVSATAGATGAIAGNIRVSGTLAAHAGATGAIASLADYVTGIGSQAGATGAVTAFYGRILRLSALAGARGVIASDYIPGMEHFLVTAQGECWRDSEPATRTARGSLTDTHPLQSESGERIQDANPIPRSVVTVSSEADPAPSYSGDRWRDAERLTASQLVAWVDAAGLLRHEADRVRDAEQVWNSSTDEFLDLPRLSNRFVLTVRDASGLTQCRAIRLRDARFLRSDPRPRWRDATYPGTAKKDPPPIPPPEPRPWGTGLHLCFDLPGTDLHIGRSCGDRAILKRRSYLVNNTAALYVWVDGTGWVETPCTSMTISTDDDAYCWSLSASLSGPDAFTLVAPEAPAYQPKMVRALINGYEWRFVLDEARLSRRFGQQSVSVSGRSRTAYLAEPFSKFEAGGNLEDPYTATQLATQALDGTGFALDWTAVDWTIPPHTFTYFGARISRVRTLANAVGAALYSHPWDAILSVYPKYPTAAWGWDSPDIVPDAVIPEDALLQMSREPDNQAAYNGIYISGTKAGVLAHIYVSGSSGTEFAPMVAEPLLTDETGQAHLARGIAELSAAGAGTTLSAETWLSQEGEDGGIGLIRPGLMVDLAGVKGMCRGTQISVRRTNDALLVRQSLRIERRDA